MDARADAGAFRRQLRSVPVSVCLETAGGGGGGGTTHRLGRAHTAAVAGDDGCGGEVGQGQGAAALVHDGGEVLHHGDKRVGGSADGCEVSLQRAAVRLSAGIPQGSHQD